MHKPIIPSEKCTLFFAQVFALIMPEKKGFGNPLR
jgi:hypothetical protein